MMFEQFYLGCLAQASYLIGSEGIAAVVDPQRDVDIYLDAARERGLQIAHIIETHLQHDCLQFAASQWIRERGEHTRRVRRLGGCQAAGRERLNRRRLLGDARLRRRTLRRFPSF